MIKAIDEIRDLLEGMKMVFYGSPKIEKEIIYKGAKIKITIEMLEKAK